MFLVHGIMWKSCKRVYLLVFSCKEHNNLKLWMILSILNDDLFLALHLQNPLFEKNSPTHNSVKHFVGHKNFGPQKNTDTHDIPQSPPFQKKSLEHVHLQKPQIFLLSSQVFLPGESWFQKIPSKTKLKGGALWKMNFTGVIILSTQTMHYDKGNPWKLL